MKHIFIMNMVLFKLLEMKMSILEFPINIDFL